MFEDMVRAELSPSTLAQKLKERYSRTEEMAEKDAMNTESHGFNYIRLRIFLNLELKNLLTKKGCTLVIAFVARRIKMPGLKTSCDFITATIVRRSTATVQAGCVEGQDFKRCRPA
ncbi:MAG: hypothetical protein IPH20_20285 [Bacteroidales bacterium]|nr:hypothetical protein [Bacteroidales bacterium]